MTAGLSWKELRYYALFTLCVALPYINFYELTFAVWGATILVSVQRNYSVRFLKYLGYFIAILFIAFAVGIFRETRLYDFVKDITYLIKPVLGLLVGYQACKPAVKDPLKMAVFAGGFIAIGHLIAVVNAIVVHRATTVNVLREWAGYFSDYEIYVIVFLLFRKEFGLSISKRTAQILLLIVGVSSFLYLARTNMIQLAVLYIAVKGYLRPTRRSVTLVTSMVVLALVSYTIIYNSNPRRGAKGIEAFFYKIKIAPMEPFKSRVDSDDWVDFNDNYRSYENILTVRQMTQDGAKTVMLGKGLGSHVDLHRKVWLQTSLMQYIPFLHNGFMTVFLKSGLLGVFIYLGSIFFFFRQGKPQTPQLVYINRLFIGTGLFLFISNWVFLGFYNLFDTKTILMGLLLAYADRIKKAQTT